jgi:phospholipid/cholesterol/gamma-HCH transport system ATP-binding protein
MESHGETVQSGLDFAVRPGIIFAITGDSGAGKSLLLRHMVGLHRPAAGEVLYDGESLWGGGDARRETLMRRLGVLFQGAVLVSSMTLLENVAVKVRLNTTLSRAEADELAALKLAVMGLRGYERYYPSQVTEGVRTRASLARATALDHLVLGLRDAMRATIVVATCDLPSLFALADDAVFLDSETKTMIARGRPEELRERGEDPKVRAFLTRGRR